MAGNSIGKIFVVTTFGESHGAGIGVVIDGCPAGIKLDMDFIQEQMNKRRPGQSKITTQRQEKDQPQILSGVFDDVTTGAPLAAFFPNEDTRSHDYSHIADRYRPSHADFTYDSKYGVRDYRGGGRSSARETVARVFAGAIARLFLKKYKIEINAYVSQVGSISSKKMYNELDFSKTWTNPVHCPDQDVAPQMQTLIETVRKDGDTIGGVVSCVIQGCPAGLGEPVFDRLHADLGKAMLSINAAKGFEYGSGFSGVSMKGSEHNDPFVVQSKKIKTSKNDSGGIQGGISNGMDIYFRIAFKPVATIMKKQNTINTQLQAVEIEGKGRHDPCVLPRAVAIVESMAAIVIADHLLRLRTVKMDNE